MARPTLGYVVKVIGDFLAEDARFVNFVEVKRLRDELCEIACCLEDADARRKSNERVEKWVRDMYKVACREMDLFEPFVLEVGRSQHGRWACMCTGALSSCLLHIPHKFKRKIQLLRVEIDDIWKSRLSSGILDLRADDEQRRHVDEAVSQRRIVRGDFHTDTVGMEDDEKAILDMLFSESVKRRFVISIVGMGGLGKTTLAKKVFEDPQVASRFDRSVWVDVTQQFQEAKLLMNLVMQVSEISPTELEKKTHEELKLCLYQSLKTMKYMIVMDDVWESEAWEIIDKHLPDEGNGSRVLITTRNYAVARDANFACPPYRMQFLNEEHSWKLFLMKAFPQADERSDCQGEFEKLGKQMVRKCGGLPLALTVLGNFLAKEKRSIEEWSRIQRTRGWLQDKEGKTFMKILALSYDDLPQNLKWCFLYFGAFPEDMTIDVQKLIRLWISEGFVKEESGISMEESAEQYLGKLVDRCLVRVAEWLPSNVKECCVHNLLHELTIAEGMELGFLHCHSTTSQCGVFHYESVRRLSLITTAEKFMSQRPRTPRLRTLLGYNFASTRMSFCTRRLKLIRVIDLEGAPIVEVPSQIGELVHLRYLGLKNTSIKSLPDSIGKLSRLLTLDIKQTLVERLSSTVWKIETLRHVLIPKGMELHGIDQGSLRNLRVLEEAVACDWVFSCFVKLESLETLRLKSIKIHHHRGLTDMLYRFLNLTTLEMEGEYIPETLLMLPVLRNLRTLMLFGKILIHYPSPRNLPVWAMAYVSPPQRCPQTLGYQWPQSVSTLKLSKSGLYIDPLPSLGKLCNLRVLELRMDAYCGKEMTCPCNAFPQLQTLSICYLRQLEKWTLDDGAMARLETLVICGSQNLATLPQGLKRLARLGKLTLADMSAALYDRVKKENGEDWENIRHIPCITVDHVRISGC